MSTALFTLAIHGLIFVVALLTGIVFYNVGLRVGHRRGMVDGKMQQILAQKQVEDMAKMHDDQGIQKDGQESG